MPEQETSIVRILIYKGPLEWIESTLRASRVPVHGELPTSRGVIKSGIVHFQPPKEQP